MVPRSPSNKRSDENRILGATIREWREDRGMSLRDFAKLTGITISALQRYETNKADISVSAYLTIEQALGLQRGFLIT